MNSLTYDYSFISQIAIDGIDVFAYLREQLKPYIQNGTKLILDGAGYYGKSIRRTMNDIKFECFSDKNPQEGMIMDLPVVSRNRAVEEYSDALFIITSMVFDREIRNELQEMGVKNILDFVSDQSCTKVSDKGDIEVDVIKLDDFFKTHESPTFIKMDIEGAELAALRGCAETIRKHKPKLAICVYHKPEDIFEIPEYILSLNPDYKMWLRHYTNLVNETVLYCE